MALGRPAKGLPRYYMDVGWYRAPQFAGLPIHALFVYEAAHGYCTEHATDGRMPGHHEDLAAALGLRASDVRKAIPPLVDRGVLERDGDELVVPNWAEQNPTAAEIEEHTAAKSEGGSYGNHVRWHEKRNRPDPDCVWCRHNTPRDRNGDRSTDRRTDRSTDPNGIADPSLGMGWDGIGLPTSSDNSRGATRTPDDDDQDHQQRVGTALAILAHRDLDERQTAPGQPPVGDPTRWLEVATRRRRDRDGPALAALARARPELTPDELAHAIGDPPDRDAAVAELAAHRSRAAEHQLQQRLTEQRQRPPDPDTNARGVQHARGALRGRGRRPAVEAS